MSHLLDRLLFFRKNVDTFSDGHGVVTREDRTRENGYRNRWSYDKIVRSTHGVNCTGSCSWDIFVKNGIVTWEMQATDYPRTRPDLPNHEPRGWWYYLGPRTEFKNPWSCGGSEIDLGVSSYFSADAPHSRIEIKSRPQGR